MDDNSGADSADAAAKAQANVSITDLQRMLDDLEHHYNVSPATGQPVSEAVNQFVLEQKGKLAQITADLDTGAIDAESAIGQSKVISDATEHLARLTAAMANNMTQAEQSGMLDEAANIRHQLTYAAQQSADDVNIRLSSVSGGSASPAPVASAQAAPPDPAVLAEKKAIAEEVRQKPVGDLTQVVYHGSPRSYDQFSQEIAAGHNDGLGNHTNAIFFTDNKDIANGYAEAGGSAMKRIKGLPEGEGQIAMARLKLNNPYISSGKEWSGVISQKDIDELKAKGYDGIITNSASGANAGKEYIVFDKSQIYSPWANSSSNGPVNYDHLFSDEETPLPAGSPASAAGAGSEADKPLPKVQLAGPRQTVTPDAAPEGFGISADGTRFQSGPVSDNSIAAIADRGEPLPQLPKVEPAGPRVVFTEQDFPAASQAPGPDVQTASDDGDFFGGSSESPAASQGKDRLTLSQEDLQPPRTPINEADLKPKIQITEADLGAAPAAGSVITPGAGSAVEPGSDLNDATVKKVQVIRSDGTVDGGWLEAGRTGDVVTVTKVQNGEILTKNVRLSDFELAQQYPAGSVIDRAAISSANVQPVGRDDFGAQYEPNGERNARPTMIDRETGMTWSVPRDGVSTTSVSTSPSLTPSSPADPVKDKPADVPAASSAATPEPDPLPTELATGTTAVDSGADSKVGWKSYEYNAPPGNQTADEWSQWKKEADAKPKVEINTAAVVSDETHPFGETGWQWTDKPKPIQQLKNADAAVENIGTELSTKVNNYVAKKYGNTKAFKAAQKVGYFRDAGSGSPNSGGESSAGEEKPKSEPKSGASTKDGRVKITVSGEDSPPSTIKSGASDTSPAPADHKAKSAGAKTEPDPKPGSAASAGSEDTGGPGSTQEHAGGKKVKPGKRTVITDESPGVDQPNHVNLRTKEPVGQPKPKHTSLIDDNSPGVDQSNHVNLTGSDKTKVHKASYAADVGGGSEEGVGPLAKLATRVGDTKTYGRASQAAGALKDTKVVSTVGDFAGKVGGSSAVQGALDVGGKILSHPVTKGVLQVADKAAVPLMVVGFLADNGDIVGQKSVKINGKDVVVSGDTYEPAKLKAALTLSTGPGWVQDKDGRTFKRNIYDSKGKVSGVQEFSANTLQITQSGSGSPYKDPATQKRIAADEKLNHKLFTPTTPGGTAPINDPNSILNPHKNQSGGIKKPNVTGLSSSQTMPEEMSTAQLSGWGWHLAKKGTSTTPAVWTKNGNTLDIYENGSATYTNTANGHAITQSVRVADARNAGFTGGGGSAAGAVPAGAVADPNHAGRYLVTTKKAGGSYNGATETNVYDKNGHLLGQNVTYYSNGKRYDYGYDFGSKPPAGVGYSSSGEVIIPGVNDKTTQTSTVAVQVSRDPGAQHINLAGGGWMASKGNDSLHAPYWYRQVGTKNGKAIYETFYPDPKTGEGVIMYDGKRSGYGQTGNLDMVGGSGTRTVTTTTNVKVASGLHFTDVNHPASTKAASAVHTLASAPAPVPIPAQPSPSYVPEPTRPKAPSLQISAAKPSGWESHSTGDLAGRITGQTLTVNGKRYEDVTVSHFTDGTSTYQVKGKIIGYGEPAGAGGSKTETKTPDNTPTPKEHTKTQTHSVAANTGTSGPGNSGYKGSTPAKNPATTMVSDHPTVSNTPVYINMVSENGGGMGAALKTETGEGAHAYTGGAAIESVKHLKNGAILTTTASGAEIETTAAGNSYVVKAAPAPASDAATAYRHGIDGGLPGATGSVRTAAGSSTAPAPTPEPARSMPHGAILAESETEGSVNPNLTPSNGGAIAAGVPAAAPAPVPTVTQSQIEAAANYSSIANTKSNDMMAPVTSGPAFTLPVSSHPTDVTATNALSNFNVTSNVRRFGRQIE